MNILKHMEATFLVVALVAVPASYFGGGAITDARAHGVTADSIAYGAGVATPTRMATVVVSAKRPDASEKRAILLAAR